MATVVAPHKEPKPVKELQPSHHEDCCEPWLWLRAGPLEPYELDPEKAPYQIIQNKTGKFNTTTHIFFRQDDEDRFNRTKVNSFVNTCMQYGWPDK